MSSSAAACCHPTCTLTCHTHSSKHTRIDTDTQRQTCTWCKGSALQAIRKQKRNSDLFLEFELTASITILKRGRKPECPEKTPDSMPCENTGVSYRKVRKKFSPQLGLEPWTLALETNALNHCATYRPGLRMNRSDLREKKTSVLLLT